MGPKVKKPVKNAFSFFIDDYVEAERKKGRNISHRIAAEECALPWRELPPEEKKVYSELAVYHKQARKLDKENKFLSTGISYAEFERQQKELEEKIEKADYEIKATISNLDSDLYALLSKTVFCDQVMVRLNNFIYFLVKTHLFYIFHCNYYCKTEEGVYVPGELAIVEFNLKDGIRRTYHTLINPGNPPLGYAFETKTRIEEVHGLPYPPFEEGDSDYFGILNKILDFIEPGKLPDGRYPPLYCIESNVKASESILKALSENQTEDSSLFRVFLLQKMFFWLKNKCVEDLDDENVGFPVMANAESEISKDMFCYVPGISCAYHMTSDDKYQSCSLSIVQRYVYVICDHCCQYIGVPLIPGQHCRLKSDTNRKDTCEEKARKPRTVGEVFEWDYDGASSYGGEDFSGGHWNKEDGACLFLHEELEYKSGNMEVSSVASRSTRNAPSVLSAYTTRAKNGGENNSDEEDFIKSVPIGRGTTHH